MFKRVTTQKDLQSAAIKNHVQESTEINSYVTDRDYDAFGNRTARIRICFSGPFGTVEFAPRNRRQTGYGGDRLEGALSVLYQCGFDGLHARIDGRPKTERVFTHFGRTYRFYVDSEVL